MTEPFSAEQHGVKRRSGAWKLLSGLVVAGGLAGAGWQQYSQSPGYIASVQLTEAEQLMEQKKAAQAIPLLLRVLESNTHYVADAKVQLHQIEDETWLFVQPADEVALAFQQMFQHGDVFGRHQVLAEKLLPQYLQTEPAAAADILALLIPVVTDDAQRLSYQQQRYDLLTRLNQASPDNLKFTSELAVMDELLNQCVRCRDLLTPFTAQLTHQQGEGARILGQALLVAQEYAAAYELLVPYASQHLMQFRQAEAAYQAALDQLWNSTLEKIEAGKASADFYQAYHAATTEEQRNQQLHQYYRQFRDSSAVVAEALKQYRQSAAIVPVAIDAGIVMLNRAMSLKGEAREQELKAAENMFLAVNTAAADSDDYQRYLGQVYFWLGQAEKGEAQFGALLKKYQRSADVLYSLADILRDLGEFNRAKSYAEEAFAKAEDKKTRQDIASFLAMMTTDPTRQIELLEQADPTDLYAQADLFAAKAKLAQEEEDKAAALEYLGNAIEAYKKVDISASQQNNIALIYGDRYGLSAKPADLQNVLLHLDKAVQLNPESAIILGNAANWHLINVYQTVGFDKLRYGISSFTADLELMQHFYNSHDEKQALVAQLAAEPSMEKALAYIDKQLILAPQNVKAIEQALALYRFMAMDDRVTDLARRVSHAHLDLSTETSSVARYQAAPATELAEYYRHRVEFWARRLKQQKGTEASFEYAWCEAKLVEAMTKLASYDADFDPDTLIEIAQQNYQRHASASSRGNLESAYVAAAVYRARKQSPELNTLYQRYERVYGNSDLLVLALKQHKSGFEPALLAKIEASIVSGMKAFPHTVSVFDALALEALGSESAARAKDKVNTNPVWADVYQAHAAISPSPERSFYGLLALAHLQGDKDKKQQLIEQAKTRGINMPEAYIRAL